MKRRQSTALVYSLATIQVRDSGGVMAMHGGTTGKVLIPCTVREISDKQIAAGTKRMEYRSRTPYWRCRLENRHESTRAYIGYVRPRCVELARVLKKTGRFSLPLWN